MSTGHKPRWQAKDITEESIRKAVRDGPSYHYSLERLIQMYPGCPLKVIEQAIRQSHITDWGVSIRHYWIVDPVTFYSTDP